MEGQICKRIGELLKESDDVHLGYYLYKDRFKTDKVPNILVGGDCLKMVINNPVRGIKFLRNRIDAFLRFSESISKRQDSTEKERGVYYNKSKNWKIHYDDIVKSLNKRQNGCLDNNSINLIMMSYFI